MSKKKNFVARCIDKLQRSIGSSISRAREICAAVAGQRKARKRAFKRTKSKHA